MKNPVRSAPTMTASTCVRVSCSGVKCLQSSLGPEASSSRRTQNPCRTCCLAEPLSSGFIRTVQLPEKGVGSFVELSPMKWQAVAAMASMGNPLDILAGSSVMRMSTLSKSSNGVAASIEGRGKYRGVIKLIRTSCMSIDMTGRITSESEQ
ncbi:hypothetical protein BJX96DRAFT_147191 [Aspergillus floccosus]